MRKPLFRHAGVLEVGAEIVERPRRAVGTRKRDSDARGSPLPLDRNDVPVAAQRDIFDLENGLVGARQEGVEDRQRPRERAELELRAHLLGDEVSELEEIGERLSERRQRCRKLRRRHTRQVRNRAHRFKARLNIGPRMGKKASACTKSGPPNM